MKTVGKRYRLMSNKEALIFLGIMTFMSYLSYHLAKYAFWDQDRPGECWAHKVSETPSATKPPYKPEEDW